LVQKDMHTYCLECNQNEIKLRPKITVYSRNQFQSNDFR
jgi:hypothetical protein